MLRPVHASERGFTLIELMIGITVGLIVLAGVANFFASYLASNRQMIQMARLDQELRSAIDILVRDLKRAGYKRDIHLDILNLTQDSSSRAATMPILDNGEVQVDASKVEFWYDENSDNILDTASSSSEKHGYRVNDNALERWSGATGEWQDITDSDVTQITELTITRTYRCIDIDDAGGPASCGGTPISPAESEDGAYFVTEVALTLSGRLTRDNSITRTLNERIRIRSDIYKDGPGGSFTY